MKKRNVFLAMMFVMAFAVVSMTGCGNKAGNTESGGTDTGSTGTEAEINDAETETGDKLKVATTIFAPYDFARQITGDTGAELTMLLKPGAESHSYEPTPQDIIKIGECDVFIYTGGENDEWVEDILESVDNPDLKAIKMLDCVDAVEEETVEGMEAEEEEETEEGGEEETEWDEHVWTDPQNAILISKALEKAFEESDPANASVYQENLASYEEVLNKLDTGFKEVTANAKRKTVVFGDRFPLRYFVEAYGLSYYAAFPGCSADTEASAATVAFLTDKVKEEQIPVVFQIELSNGNIAKSIAEATGAKTETFYSCHNVTQEDFDAGVTYVELMERNVELLKEALN